MPTSSRGAVAKELIRLFSPPPPPSRPRLGPGGLRGPNFDHQPLAKPSPHCPLGSQGQRSRDCSLHPALGLLPLLHLFSESHWSFQEPE